VNNDGEVSVSAPVLMPKRLIDKTVEKNIEWIERQKRKLELSHQAMPVIDWSNNLISFMGNLYLLKIKNGQNQIVNISHKVMWVNPPGESSVIMKKAVLQWLKQQARKEINQRVRKWAKKMKVNYKKVRIGQQKSRWGSSSSSGTLSFNWRLVHFAPEVIDYVVIHELAHVRQPNHSKKFWAEVEKWDPKYIDSVKFLKKQRVRLE
jgi:predicted metal-dependent hydrolase